MRGLHSAPEEGVHVLFWRQEDHRQTRKTPAGLFEFPEFFLQSLIGNLILILLKIHRGDYDFFPENPNIFSSKLFEIFKKPRIIVTKLAVILIFISTPVFSLIT